jgi:hypothetical protein
MSPAGNQNPEKIQKRPTVTESVENLIAKKKAERASTGAAEVQEKAVGVQSEVAEVMAGVEKPKEKVSEREGESGEKGDIKAGKGAAAAQYISPAVQSFSLPGEERMIKKIRIAIKHQIKLEQKKAKRLEKNLTRGGAQEYTQTIARIRTLKEILASLLTATYDFVKGVYLKYFTPDGKKKHLEEI